MSRKQTMKVYHGIPKSIADEHTIFYDSMERIPEGVSQLSTTNVTFFKYGVIGAYPNFLNGSTLLKDDIVSSKPVTVDLWLNDIPEKGQVIIRLEDDNKNELTFQKAATTGKIYFTAYVNSLWKNEVVVSSSIIPSGTFHIRYVADIQNSIGRAYINGKLIGEVSLKNIINSFSNFTGKFTKLSFACVGLSDLHISNIDRGDYFPNLPQDFIDGKAIIKPRMGQQQIKGDPLYSQYTLLKVPCSIENGEILYGDYNKTTGLERNLKSPELYASHTRDWRNGARISIKGLNGEIISGVIDSDTALCTVTKEYAAGTIYIDVDDISKLSVNDKIKIWDKINNDINPKVFTINNIDNTLKRITLTENINWKLIPNKHYIIEVTESSSSPVVKTEDGTVVLGTWTGLGTNEATFTLGDNSNITGKDLYIEYSLIIPNNNSDFNELPYNIDKAWTENGIEMTPVNEIVITDDFKGKISGSMKECPHYSGYRATSSLLLPSSGLFIEEPPVYENITNLDNATREIYNKTNTAIPQQVFIFDLVKMVERKFGCEIPSVDKVKWLKENIIKISVNHHGYGKGPNGNKIYMKVLHEGEWVGTVSHTSPTVTSKIFSWGGSGNTGNIDGGKVSFLVYTDASDGTTASTIYTDYISIEITLKVDSAFTTLYCKNTRAREDKCNPVLIQKETKTVKRYLPSKECFTTEHKYVNPKYEKNSKLNNTVYKSDFIYFTTLGSGKYIESNLKEYFANCLNYLGNDANNLIEPHNFINNVIKSISNYNLRFIKVPATTSNSNPYDALPLDISIDSNVVSLKPFLVNRDNELKLELHIAIYKNKNISKEDIFSYSLQNRLLIK